jgi:hypothetical protein
MKTSLRAVITFVLLLSAPQAAPAKTKTEILAYLHETFVMMDGEITKTRLDNLMAPVQGFYAGDNRFEVLNSALWHISDHYGQLVEYLRMNGIVPPASR